MIFIEITQPEIFNSYHSCQHLSKTVWMGMWKSSRSDKHAGSIHPTIIQHPSATSHQDQQPQGGAPQFAKLVYKSNIWWFMGVLSNSSWGLSTSLYLGPPCRGPGSKSAAYLLLTEMAAMVSPSPHCWWLQLLQRLAAGCVPLTSSKYVTGKNEGQGIPTFEPPSRFQPPHWWLIVCPTAWKS